MFGAIDQKEKGKKTEMQTTVVDQVRIRDGELLPYIEILSS